MANDYRNESRKGPPSDRYGTPGTQYPTPNPFDVVITEEVTSRAAAFEPVLFGTPHPVVTAAVLCYQSPVKSGNTDKAPVRAYANPRLAQEPYNLVTGDDEANDTSFPTFIRSYLLPRGYTPGTIGSALTALIGLTLVSGGTGYVAATGSTKTPLIFTGGAGTGAAGFAEIIAGVIVAVVLTNGGSGYTAGGLPTISAATGSGLSVTALLQPVTALLVSEMEQPAEEPFGGWFVRVTRIWETVPGKPIVTYPEDSESHTTLTVTRTKKLLSAITPGYSHDSDTTATRIDKEPIDGLYGWEIVTVIPKGPHFSEATAMESETSRPYRFPATLDIDAYIDSGNVIGTTRAFVQDVPHVTKTWWVIAATRPTLSLNGLIEFGVALNIFGDDPLGELIYNATADVAAGSAVYDLPGSTPDYTTYAADWIGGDPRSIAGGVRSDGNLYRFRVEKTFIQFKKPSVPVLDPP